MPFKCILCACSLYYHAKIGHTLKLKMSSDLLSFSDDKIDPLISPIESTLTIILMQNGNKTKTLGISCLFALGVNISNYLVLGQTSPLTYQVLGHMKTVLIIVLGFVVFKVEITDLMPASQSVFRIVR